MSTRRSVSSVQSSQTTSRSTSSNAYNTRTVGDLEDAFAHLATKAGLVERLIVVVVREETKRRSRKSESQKSHF